MTWADLKNRKEESMQRVLSKLRSWELDHEQEDVRGWPLRDVEGHALGTVSELLVDTESKRVTKIMLDDGSCYPAHDVIVGNRVLLLGGTGRLKNERAEAARAAVTRDSAELRREPATDGGELVLPLVDEEIQIGKRVVDSGGVTIRTHVVEKPFEQEVRLVEEHVEVERCHLDRPVGVDEAEALFQQREIEVPARSEEAVVEKRAHVVEEVVLKRTVANRVQTLRDTVRHSEAEIVGVRDGQPAAQKRS
jgi:uncharacterized protein (TIGR02271 family)